ncbi:hypothetical protein [Bradyrhizobium sp. SYSU BS000235]|uniref:hypothetical protein n=1 Tax=Bradyrhizobium sp. SYSU BS000235 TaxID=3411332 RepID=UPI003C7149DA
MRTIPIMVVFSMLGISVALAQNTTPGMTTGAGSSANSSSSSSSTRGIPQAPVGHRQPKASDVPAGTESGGYSESAQDKELDRKIKSICRGC